MFVNHDVDGAALLALDKHDLVDMGMRSVGHRAKLLSVSVPTSALAVMAIVATLSAMIDYASPLRRAYLFRITVLHSNDAVILLIAVGGQGHSYCGFPSPNGVEDCCGRYDHRAYIIVLMRTRS